VLNLEAHAPLLGLLRATRIRRIPVEVVGFFDLGLVWSREDLPDFFGGGRQMVRSAGVATRVNLFGFLLVEVSAAHPFDRVGGGLQWQIGLRQGF
jgi:hypothetical protein